MQTLNIKDIALDLQRAATYYINDAMEDRLSGLIRERFNMALDARGTQDVAEITQPAAVFGDVIHDGGSGMLTTIGNTQYRINRIVGSKKEIDIEDLCYDIDTHKFIPALQEAINEYVQLLDFNITIATVPAFYCSCFAYNVNWFLWGYAGKPNI